MKKLLTFCFVILCVFGAAACDVKATKFSGAGATLTLTNKFKVTNSTSTQLIIENQADDIAVLVKADVKDSKYADLSAYIAAILEKAGKESEIEHNADKDFYYSAYTSTVDKKEYKYLAVCLEGDENYYTVTFGCNLKDYEQHSPSFMDWAKTITVK